MAHEYRHETTCATEGGQQVSGDLVVRGGGAIVPSTDGGAEHGDLPRDIAAGVRWTDAQPACRNILRDLVIDGMIPADVIDRCLPLIQSWGEALSVATTWETKTRIADHIRDDLIGKGLLTVEQIERIKPILRRLSTPTLSDAGVKGRIAEIEKWMSARRGSAEYKRYYEDPLLQNEYRQLLQRIKQ